jgi:hypothetical protein
MSPASQNSISRRRSRRGAAPHETLGLVHIAPATRTSVMNPDNVITPPTDDDQRTLEALWGRCR